MSGISDLVPGATTDRQTFLLALSDRLRAFSEPLDVMYAALEMTGRHLAVNRIGYCDVENEDGTAFYPVGWADGVLTPLTGRVPMTFLGDAFMADLQAGRMIGFDDADLDPRVPPGSFAAIGTRAGLGLPIVRDGVWVAGLFVNHATVRVWRPDEIGLLQDVLERTWDAVERARAEAGRHKAEQRQALLFNLILQQRRASGEHAVLNEAACAIGQFLGADRTGFFELPDDENLVFTHCWTAGRLPVLDGPFPAIGIGAAALAQIRRGEAIVFSDARTDPLVAGSVFTQIDTLSGIGTPIIRDGQWRAGLYINSSEPRLWRADEITLVREIVELTWDAVERLRAQSGLAARTLERDRAWSLARELLVITRPDGTLEAVNPIWTAVLGWAEHELLGQPFTAFTHPDDLDATAAALEGILREPLITPYECRFRHSDGSYRWIGWTGSVEGGRVYAAGRDLTRERETEEALRQSQKMEAVGQLTGGLAHDFNNLLAGISGALELMQNRMGQGRFGDLDRYMTVAQGAAKRAAALTHRLLAFSRRQTLDPKPTNVNRLISGMEELIRRTIGPEVALEVVGAGGLWSTLIDSGQLENALLNLCINARDAMPGGGRITIETANKWLDRPTAAVRAIPEGQYLSVCVTDTGTGMPPEIVAKVFEPFFTTKPLGQGTGLGLSMIYGFAQQSGGQVRIYSEVGQGTTVCLYLPRHYGDADADDGGLEITVAARAEQGETVLIVDDEPSVRMLVTEVLEDLGYTAIEAADSVAGLKVLQSDVRIDLLVTDVGLPGGMNGRQMADAARVGRPDLKVLFITGYAENAVVGNGHLEPGMQVLTKPFAMDALGARIRELIPTS